MDALSRLVEAGVITQDETVRMWLKGEWHEVQLQVREITDGDEGYTTEVADLLNRGLTAYKQDDYEPAVRLFRRALELDPSAKEAYNNLGTIHARRGEHVEAREMFQRAVALDPLYATPRCNLAVYLLGDGDVKGAEAMLEPLADTGQFNPQELSFYFYTQARVLLRQNEYDAARQALRDALDARPDYEPAKNLLDRLNQTSPIFKNLASVTDRYRQRDRAKRARLQAKLTTSSPSLFDALSIYTKNALTGMGRVVLLGGKWSALRKAELIQEIVEALTDLDNLERIAADLGGDARTALRQVLTDGGSMSWQNFDARYGNDMEESPYWNWHTPKTTMGQLRLRGLLAEAMVEGELQVVIPVELRQGLKEVLD